MLDPQEKQQIDEAAAAEDAELDLAMGSASDSLPTGLG